MKYLKKWSHEGLSLSVAFSSFDDMTYIGNVTNENFFRIKIILNQSHKSLSKFSL